MSRHMLGGLGVHDTLESLLSLVLASKKQSHFPGLYSVVRSISYEILVSVVHLIFRSLSTCCQL